jgi:hypothetical protein
VYMASYASLDTDEIGAAGGTMPIFFMSSTSPRLEVDMCANGLAAIRLLLIGRGRFEVAAFCLSGLAINGDFRLCCTSSVNRVRRRAASLDVGVTSLGVGVSIVMSTPGCPTRRGVTCGCHCTGDNRGESIV